MISEKIEKLKFYYEFVEIQKTRDIFFTTGIMKPKVLGLYRNSEE